MSSNDFVYILKEKIERAVEREDVKDMYDDLNKMLELIEEWENP